MAHSRCVRDLRQKSETAPRDGPDHSLLVAAIVDRSSCPVAAGRDGRLGDNAPIPDIFNVVIFAYQLTFIESELAKQVHKLGFNLHGLAFSEELALFKVQFKAFKVQTVPGIHSAIINRMRSDENSVSENKEFLKPF